MIKNKYRSNVLFAAAAVLSAGLHLRAAQPPEIINISYPVSAVINGAGGPESAISGDALATDSAGNTYVTGRLEGRASFDATVGVTNTGWYGSPDGYVVKYDPSHNPVWVKHISGRDNEVGKAIAVNAAGEIYVAGTSTSSTLNVAGTNIASPQMFLAKLSSNGDVQWVQNGGSWISTNFINVSGQVDVTDVVVDRNGDPILVGNAVGQPMIGGQVTGTFPSVTRAGGVIITNQGTSADLYLAKFSASGEILWAKNYGDTNNEYASAIAIGPDNDIYVAGSYAKTTTLGNTTHNGFPAGMSGFAARFGTDGQVKWSASYSKFNDTYSSYGRSIAVDSAGRLTVAIQTGMRTFSLGAFTIENSVAGPVFDPVYMGILARYEANGILSKVVRAPFNASGYGEVNHSLAIKTDLADNVILRSDSALMPTEFLFGKGGLSFLKYDSQLTPVWTNRVSPEVGGSTVHQYRSSHAFAFDGAGNIHVASTFKADAGSRLQFGWVNFSPFTAYGDQLVVFEMRPAFLPVAPVFTVNPVELFYQAPAGWTNFGQARGWPAPLYQWFQDGNPLPRATNQFLAYTQTTLTNRGAFYLVASNNYGVSTSLVAQVRATLAFDLLPPPALSVLIGNTITLGAIASGLEPISYQWKHAGTNLPGATSANLTLTNVTAVDAGSYVVVASNSSGSLTSAPASVLNLVDFGAVDPSIAYQSEAGYVVAMVVNADDSVVVSNGRNLFRINANGTADTSVFTNKWQFFNEDYGPKTIIPDGNGKYMVGGDFQQYYAGQTVTPVNRVARVNADGSLDSSFNVGAGPTNSVDGATFSRVSAIVKQPDGKYIIGGYFTRFANTPMTNIARVNADGSLDASFAKHSFRVYTDSQFPGPVKGVALQSDGKIIVVGSFSVLDGQAVRGIARLNADGSLDNTFVQPPVPFTPFADLQTVKVLADGKIMVAGSFGATDTFTRNIMRLNTDGSHDLTFAGSLQSRISVIFEQPDGKVIVGAQGALARFDAAGALDAKFKADPTLQSRGIEAIARTSAGGHLLVGGGFGVARLLIENFTETPPGPTFNPNDVKIDSSGVFSFSVCGQPGQTVKIQMSADLENWVDYATQTTGECATVTDANARANPSRYYRAVVMP